MSSLLFLCGLSDYLTFIHASKGGVRVTAVEGEEWALSSAEVLVSRSPIANLVEDERGAVREQDIARIKESEEVSDIELLYQIGASSQLLCGFVLVL